MKGARDSVQDPVFEGIGFPSISGGVSSPDCVVGRTPLLKQKESSALVDGLIGLASCADEVIFGLCSSSAPFSSWFYESSRDEVHVKC